MIQLGQQIKNLRTANHLSQEDLAQKLFVSRQSISKYENGEATPDVEKLIQMAEIFEVSLDFLIPSLLRCGPGRRAGSRAGRRPGSWWRGIFYRSR